MKTQITSDNHISLNHQLSSFVEGEVERELERFRERLTRVEVHLSDENAGKGGGEDKRCVIEVHAAGLDPMTTRDVAATVEEAVTGASHKMKRLLEATFGKLSEKR